MGRKVSIDLDKEEEIKVQREEAREEESDFIDYDDFI